MTNSSTSPNFNNKPARRRQARPEQISISVERVEHLVVEVKNAQAITQLIDGLERRLAIVEDSMPAGSTISFEEAHAMLSRTRDGLRSNGAAHN